MTELVKVDPKEFGLEELKAQEIEAQFKPMLEKMTELEKEFNEVIKMELDEKGIEAAKSLRSKYVKVRTGTAAIHKQQKSFYLAGGRFVDGWKNAQLFASQGKEDALMEREKHFENIEKERIENLRIERWGNLSKYMEIEPQGLGHMDESVYNHFLNGAKSAHEAKIEAEKKAEAERLESERIEKLSRERTETALPYLQYWTEFEKTLKLGEVSQRDFDAFMERNKKAKSDHEAEQEKQRKENERLKIEAEKREKAIADERKKQAEKEAKEHAEREIERAIMERKLKAEADAREKAERKIREQKEAEEKARKQAEAEAKKAAKAPLKTKLNVWVNSFDLPITEVDNDVTEEIKQKFEAFKKWAISQIETL